MYILLVDNWENKSTNIKIFQSQNSGILLQHFYRNQFVLFKLNKYKKINIFK